ncbi:MAG TPA: lipid-A-disaccharide synthase N-terminal domain-containing protein [Methylomirabilota bacterium]|nr:lipid-A-disaccharide synthase N-terminal domain-containing protein [Methylomirabilota bacterium]
MSVWQGNQFLGIEWHFWKVLGWTGNLIFFSRLFVQWVATERRKQVVIPTSFWWLSLIGSMLLLAYGIWQRDSVFIFAYAFTWIPYIRSLVIHYRNKASQKDCPGCRTTATREILFCQRCGSKLPTPSEPPFVAPAHARSAFA